MRFTVNFSVYSMIPIANFSVSLRNQNTSFFRIVNTSQTGNLMKIFFRCIDPNNQCNSDQIINVHPLMEDGIEREFFTNVAYNSSFNPMGALWLYNFEERFKLFSSRRDFCVTRSIHWRLDSVLFCGDTTFIKFNQYCDLQYAVHFVIQK